MPGLNCWFLQSMVPVMYCEWGGILCAGSSGMLLMRA